MGRLSSLTYRDLETVIKKLNFEYRRQKGSHKLYGHKDGRRVTISVHQGKNIKDGLAHKIITKEIGISIDEFFRILRGD